MIIGHEVKFKGQQHHQIGSFHLAQPLIFRNKCYSISIYAYVLLVKKDSLANSLQISSGTKWIHHNFLCCIFKRVSF